MKAITIAVLTLVMTLLVAVGSSQAQIISPTGQHEISLLSTQTYVSGIIYTETGEISNLGNFSITVRITAVNEDLYIRKDYDLLSSPSHVLVLKIGGAVVSNIDASSYLISLGDTGSDTANSYFLADGASRDFMFFLSGFTPRQTGVYTWELTTVEVATPPFELESSYWYVGGSQQLKTQALYLERVVPEPSTFILLIAFGATLLHRRKR